MRGEFWSRGLLLALVLIALVPSRPVLAATFGELYTVSVARESEGRELEREEAIRRGMQLLLTRITGRQQAAAYPEMQDLIRNASSYLDGYDLLEDEIRVAFIRSAVVAALERIDMPIWGDERPATLLWVATDFGDGQRAELQADAAAINRWAGAVAGVASNELEDEQAEFFETVTGEILAAADERGLPLVLPLLDARDRTQVRFADVWGGFDGFVASAADRYDVDAVLIARVSPAEFGVEVDWTIRRGDSRQTLTTPGTRTGIDWLADEFALEYATSGGTRPTYITIRGIESPADYGRVMRYLRSVSIVEDFEVDSSSGGEFVLRVIARGDQSRLESVFTLDGELLAAEREGESPEGPGSAQLIFVPSWRRSADTIELP